ncbi:hypothetical protein [Halomarina rubra]|uniref:Uncharacterized protein n=1 Tax=Halomarina rubra TaxID=2071873 RepID=A0ABD6AST0_9EURY|nr:hypothetical protein [Halomarina rubra]
MSEASPTPDEPPTARERPYRPETTHGLSAFPDVEGGPLVEWYEVGDGKYDDRLQIWNGAGAREGRLVLTAGGDIELLNVSHEFPEDGYLELFFHSAADYTAEIRLGDVEHTVSIPSEQFDCNDWSVGVAVRESSAEDRTMTTDMACE